MTSAGIQPSTDSDESEIHVMMPSNDAVNMTSSLVAPIVSVSAPDRRRSLIRHFVTQLSMEA